MKRGAFYRYRCVRAVLALAGMVLYAALVPGHVVSQASMAFGAADLASAVQASPAHDHHGDMANAGGADRMPGSPAAPEKKCPFCKGYAAFQAALAGGADAGILDAARAAPNVFDAWSGIVYAVLRLPRNRSPPIELQSA